MWHFFRLLNNDFHCWLLTNVHPESIPSISHLNQLMYVTSHTPNNDWHLTDHKKFGINSQSINVFENTARRIMMEIFVCESGCWYHLTGRRRHFSFFTCECWIVIKHLYNYGVNSLTSTLISMMCLDEFGWWESLNVQTTSLCWPIFLDV